MIGALTHFISHLECHKQGQKEGHFQPMPANFGLLPELSKRIKDKRSRYGAYRDRALQEIKLAAQITSKNLSININSPAANKIVNSEEALSTEN